jgi:hypothetical protein
MKRSDPYTNLACEYDIFNGSAEAYQAKEAVQSVDYGLSLSPDATLQPPICETLSINGTMQDMAFLYDGTILLMPSSTASKFMIFDPSIDTIIDTGVYLPESYSHAWVSYPVGVVHFVRRKKQSDGLSNTHTHYFFWPKTRQLTSGTRNHYSVQAVAALVRSNHGAFAPWAFLGPIVDINDLSYNGVFGPDFCQTLNNYPYMSGALHVPKTTSSTSPVGIRISDCYYTNAQYIHFGYEGYYGGAYVSDYTTSMASGDTDWNVASCAVCNPASGTSYFGSLRQTRNWGPTGVSLWYPLSDSLYPSYVQSAMYLNLQQQAVGLSSGSGNSSTYRAVICEGVQFYTQDSTSYASSGVVPTVAGQSEPAFGKCVHPLEDGRHVALSSTGTSLHILGNKLPRGRKVPRKYLYNPFVAYNKTAYLG